MLEPHNHLFSKIEHNGAWQDWTLHHTCNIAQYYVVKTETYLLWIDQLDMNYFTKIINMFRVGIQPPFFWKLQKQLNNENLKRIEIDLDVCW